MRRPPLDKRAFYSQPAVSNAYDEQRFGGLSGARVNEREIELVKRLLPVTGRVLDLACGTGRVTSAIAQRGQSVVGLDFSPPMAAKTKSLGVPTVIGDGFRTPFADGAFDSVISIRFAFHWSDLPGLLAEMGRVARPGGTLVFDTYTWTPRAVLALGNQAWGGKVHLHAPRKVAATADTLGLRIVRAYPCFLFSPYVYRLAPLPLEQLFERLERQVPRALLCRVFWQLQAATPSD